MPAVQPTKSSRTCDNCRKRKIKCVESEVDPNREPCEGCRSLMIQCTHDYIKKKPGRKNNFAMTVRAEQAAKRIGDQSPYSSHQSSFSPPTSSSRDTYHNHSMGPPSSTSPNNFRNQPYPSRPPTKTEDQMYNHQPTPPSVNGQTQTSFNNNPILSSFAFQASPARMVGTESTGISWLDSMLDPSSSTSLGLGTGGMGNGFGDFMFDDMGFGHFPSEQAQLLSLESPPNQLPSGMGVMNNNGITRVMTNGPSPTNSNPRESPAAKTTPVHVAPREPQLEDVASWSNISHYLSLFLQYLYPILPLVHRPTFASNLATRLDLQDTDFRALLLSIVACTISQLPTSRLLNEHYDIEGLKRLQRRCHRTSQALQRSYHGTINLTQICIIIFDNFYLVSIGLSHTAGARLGVAVQLAYSLGLHSDSRTEALGLDFVEVQLRRRVFWQLYCSDKTRAIPGHPMLINDFQGVCSYPEPIDDEYITTQGIFQQPKNRTSLLAGFISVCQIFKILSESFFHHRCITTLSSSGGFGSRSIGMEWTVEAEDRIHRVLREMPGAIRESDSVLSEALRQVFGMQRANILITAAIAKFALYDLRAALDVDEEQLGRDRETIAREIHSLLIAIPVEDLASNGESVRAKVFHIACALCSQVPANDTDQELIKDWCNMFSAITFVQMPPPPPDVAADSRANTPPPTNEPG